MDVKKTFKHLARSPIRRAIAEADALRDARDWPAAVNAYARALAIDPGHAAAWVQYGHALKESGKREDAEAAYRRALAIDDSNADTYLQLGHLLKIGGRATEAADAYMIALERDNGLADALREIQDLALRGATVPADRLEAVIDRISGSSIDIRSEPATEDPASLAAALERLRAAGLGVDDFAAFDDVASRLRQIAARTAICEDDERASDTLLVFDASDLVHHFCHSRLPTGIQRVQLEIIRSLARPDPDRVRICAAYHERWIQIPTGLFLMLADLSTSGSDTQAPNWRSVATRLAVALGTDRAYQFPEGACLVNLGTSWHVDYLLKVRNAKRQYRIRFVPFIHDLIPIVAPQYVVPDLTRDYVAWLIAVFDHADFFLTNSQATRRDLLAAAEKLGHRLEEEDVLVVPLDARFSGATIGEETRRDLLRAHGLHGQPFVLFVATIEPRKNHLGAINAWIALLGEFGSRMPKLVCVGCRGWMNDDVFGRVSSDDELARHILFLHGLSDAELAACYDACLFTLFPSHFEGWGLPVTESLCHGKVPLLSDSSSLPEVGGPFAVYFESGSQPGLVEALRKLIGDPEYRSGLERRITAEFKARSWEEVAGQIDSGIEARFAAGERDVRSGIPEVQLGSLYAFSKNMARRLRPDLVSGYALRAGSEWHSPEDWGSWTRGAVVEIAGRFSAETPIRAFVGVRGMPNVSSTVTVSVDGKELAEAPLPGSEVRWLPLSFQPGREPVRIELRSDRVQSLASVTNGEDNRTVGPGLLGFYACAANDLGARLAFIEALATGVMIPGALDRAVGTEAPNAALAMLERQAAGGIAEDSPPEPAEVTQVQGNMLPAPGTRSSLDETPITANATRGEILLLQSSDVDVYAPMLAQSARTTRAYARRHDYRYESFLGIKRGCLPWHASYNRIDMLTDLIRADFQGWVFYIDADAWITDLDFDLRAYLAGKERYALIAAPAGHYRDHYWNVNNGVVLFNLGHPFARAFILEWERFLSRYDIAAEAKNWNVEIHDDQGMFHQILDKLPYAADRILIENKEFLNSPWASFVRHAIRAENADFGSRLAHIAEEIDKVLGVETADDPVEILAPAAD